ncbi:hypothetical protein F5879DRAFT_557427 [Lentinula edodes]|nr:hypothetical protein F5879DRAFT_557427 [Lentinula edodes]
MIREIHISKGRMLVCAPNCWPVLSRPSFTRKVYPPPCPSTDSSACEQCVSSTIPRSFFWDFLLLCMELLSKPPTKSQTMRWNPIQSPKCTRPCGILSMDTKRFGKLDTENNPWNTRYEAIVIALNAGGSLRAPPGLKLKARPSPAVPTKIRTRVEQYFQHQFPRLRTVVNFAEDSYYESKDFEQSFSILYKWKGEDRTWMANI